MQIVLGFTVFWAAKQGPAFFIIWISLIVFTEGGHFTLIPNAIQKVFGKQLTARVYGFAFIG